MKLAIILLSFLFLVNISSALVLTDARADVFSPGGEGKLIITLDNEDKSDISDVWVSLNLANTPFTTVGASSINFYEIESDESEDFIFTLKANSNAEIGDYNIPYKIKYKDNENSGTVGISVRTKSDLDFVASLDNPILGEKSKLSLKIINKGLSEIRFATLRLYPDGFDLFSEGLVYIGEIDSDDFESADFEIMLNEKTPNVIARLEYRDNDNKLSYSDIMLPLTVYSKERAIELGLKDKSNSLFYVILIGVLILIYLIYRFVRKRSKKNKNRMPS